MREVWSVRDIHRVNAVHSYIEGTEGTLGIYVIMPTECNLVIFEHSYANRANAVILSVWRFNIETDKFIYGSAFLRNEIIPLV